MALEVTPPEPVSTSFGGLARGLPVGQQLAAAGAFGGQLQIVDFPGFARPVCLGRGAGQIVLRATGYRDDDHPSRDRQQHHHGGYD